MTNAAKEPVVPGRGEAVERRIAAGAVGMAPRRAARRHGPVVSRQSSESYFEVAFGLLAEGGAEAVTVVNLCDALGVTKGSFYYHFYNMPDFIEAFVEHWEQSFLAAMSEHVVEPDPLRQMGGVMTTIARLNHEAEAALRAWGHSNPVVEAAQTRIDLMGEQFVAACASHFIADEQAVALVAHQAIALSIGLQHRPKPIDRMRYLQSIANLAELTCHVHAQISAEADGPSVVFERVSD
ncbi:MAG: TetR/AcrR family transcriptional regulator [Sporichthyaceae bacterium]